MTTDKQKHQDRGQLYPPVTTHAGTLIEGRAARVHGPGDPLVYPHGNEYRDAAEVANIASQLPGTPVKLGHGGRVVGHVVAARVDDDHAIATMMITDQAALAEIARGTKELSIGYKCRADANGYQRGISLKGDDGELAIVPLARCGASCQIQDHKDCDCTKAIKPSLEIKRPAALAVPAPVIADERRDDHGAAVMRRNFRSLHRGNQ